MVLALATSAQATYIGRSWVVTGTEAPWLGGTMAVFPIPTTALDATFTSTTVNWSNPPGSGSLSNFLHSNPGTTVTTCLAVTVPITYNCNTDVISTGTAGTQTSTTYGQIIDIVGTAETFVAGTTYSITHDDGITVLLDGLPIITSPGPQSGTVSTFTASGVHNIEILYGECCGNAAILTSNLPTNATTVPEPGNLALVLGTLLTGVGLLFRRKVHNGKA
jgi:hypothetical protein